MSKCEHGHPVELIDCCLRCGAPQCCPWCCEVQALEDDLRIAKRDLDIAEKWQDKVTDIYPVIAAHITQKMK